MSAIKNDLVKVDQLLDEAHRLLGKHGMRGAEAAGLVSDAIRRNQVELGKVLTEAALKEAREAPVQAPT